MIHLFLGRGTCSASLIFSSSAASSLVFDPEAVKDSEMSAEALKLKHLNAYLLGLTRDGIKKIVALKSIDQRSVWMEDAVLVH